jgi:hypothetical protein
VLAIGSALLGVLFVIISSWQQWWPAIGRFFVNQPPLGLIGGYPLVVAALPACAGYLTIRRATAYPYLLELSVNIGAARSTSLGVTGSGPPNTSLGNNFGVCSPGWENWRK